MTIKGSVPAYSLYGEPVSSNVPIYMSVDSFLVAGGMDYERGNRCSFDNDTCEGYRVKGEVLCNGHLRQTNNRLKSEALVSAGLPSGI